MVTNCENPEVTKVEALLHVFTAALGVHGLVFNLVGLGEP